MLSGGRAGAWPAEPIYVRLLRLAVAATAAALVAFMLLLAPSGSDSIEHEKNKDPSLVWHEEKGVTKLVPRVPPAIERRGSLPKYTLADVATHCTMQDLWVVIDARAYDLTKFAKAHPGGIGPLANMAGRDCTDVFHNYHSARVYQHFLPKFLVGEVTDVVTPEHVKDFRHIRQELLRRGLFETDARSYVKLGTWLALLFLSSLYLTLGGRSTSARLGGAAIMGLFWQQLAGIGHDLGHSGVSHDFRKDHLAGSMLAALMGLSTCWWKSDHNTHHIVCNAVEHDPNIQHLPVLCVDPKIFSRPFWDTYHMKWVGLDFAARALVGAQHVLFYPLMAVARFNLYAQGLYFLVVRNDTAHFRRTELGALTFFCAWLALLVGYGLPDGERAYWLLVSHAVAGILHVQIVLSHWAMPTYLGRAYTGAHDEWYIMQARPRPSSRPLPPRPDPSLPSHRLARAAPDDDERVDAGLARLGTHRPPVPDRAPPLPTSAKAQPAPRERDGARGGRET